MFKSALHRLHCIGCVSVMQCNPTAREKTPGPDATLENVADLRQIDPNSARIRANSTPMAANSTVLFRSQPWGVFAGASTWSFSGRRRHASPGDNSFHRHGHLEPKGVGVVKCKK